ncbi:hypothetical protein MMC28_010138 [Mycoblastus sanguinarius]|nr:hypothetical protein [Mycoblastus sanguinarius]
MNSNDPYSFESEQIQEQIQPSKDLFSFEADQTQQQNHPDPLIHISATRPPFLLLEAMDPIPVPNTNARLEMEEFQPCRGDGKAEDSDEDGDETRTPSPSPRTLEYNKPVIRPLRSPRQGFSAHREGNTRNQNAGKEAGANSRFENRGSKPRLGDSTESERSRPHGHAQQMQAANSAHQNCWEDEQQWASYWGGLPVLDFFGGETIPRASSA